ncbi:MAG: hypothetical protein ACKORJ_12175, partial [Bacteroidota bacterium]
SEDLALFSRHAVALEEQFGNKIRSLIEGLEINELEMLLSDLRAYAEQHQIRALQHHLSRLSEDAEHFDLDRLSTDLRELDALIKNQ